jgi:hypothetical protein
MGIWFERIFPTQLIASPEAVQFFAADCTTDTRKNGHRQASVPSQNALALDNQDFCK